MATVGVEGLNDQILSLYLYLQFLLRNGDYMFSLFDTMTDRRMDCSALCTGCTFCAVKSTRDVLKLLADRTNGRAYATVSRPSVVCRLNGAPYRKKLSEEARCLSPGINSRNHPSCQTTVLIKIKLVNGSRFYRVLESVGIASALSIALLPFTHAR